MSDDEQDIAIELTDKCTTQGQWVSLMQFGLGTLLNAPDVLMECIVRRAERMKTEAVVQTKCTADYAAGLMRELGLQFAMKDPQEKG